MKKFLLTLLMLVIFTTIINARDVTIHQIKIIGNTYTNERIIRDYLPELKEGDKLDQHKLEEILKIVNKRLNRSGYFFGITNQIIQARTGTGNVNILIELTEGFLYRFNLGNNYGQLGICNISGSGKDAALMLGAKTLAIQYSDQHPESGNFIYDTSFGISPVTFHNSSGTEVTNRLLGAKLFAGKFITPELKAGVSLAGYTLYDSNLAYLTYYYYPEFTLLQNTTNDTFSPTSGKIIDLSAGYVFNQKMLRLVISLNHYKELIPDSLILASRFSAAIQSGSLKYDYFGFNESNDNGLRTKLTKNYYGKDTVIFSNELRYILARNYILGFIEVTVQPLVFLDLGKVTGYRSELFEKKTDYAYGTGIRLLIGDPIYIPVRLEWGWGANGKPLALFSFSTPI